MTRCIKDKEFYEANWRYWFGEPSEDKLTHLRNEKQLLGLAVEKEGTCMIALAPKCYTISSPEKTVIKMKGVSARLNQFNIYKYIKALDSPIAGTNRGIQQDRTTKDLVFNTVNKTALSGIHTKMHVLNDESCAPFGFDGYISSIDYKKAQSQMKKKN